MVNNLNVRRLFSVQGLFKRVASYDTFRPTLQLSPAPLRLRNLGSYFYTQTNKDIIKFFNSPSLRDHGDVYRYLDQVLGTNPQHADANLDAVNISTIMHRIAKLNKGPFSKSPIIFESQHLIALADKISRCPTDFNGQAIGNALYGLQRMSRSAGTEAVLRALAGKIKDIDDFSGQNIGLGLYGLQLMDHSVGTEAVLLALAEKIEGIDDFNGQAIG
ncbi:hypothetical protein EBR96_06420, partial [bacterium]|nr:hypothetical protein [bacterium]